MSKTPSASYLIWRQKPKSLGEADSPLLNDFSVCFSVQTELHEYSWLISVVHLIGLLMLISSVCSFACFSSNFDWWFARVSRTQPGKCHQQPEAMGSDSSWLRVMLSRAAWSLSPASRKRTGSEFSSTGGSELQAPWHCPVISSLPVESPVIYRRLLRRGVRVLFL